MLYDKASFAIFHLINCKFELPHSKIHMKIKSLIIFLTFFLMLNYIQTINSQPIMQMLMKDEEKLIALQNFQFGNYTGYAISEQMKQYYNQTINKAYSLYGNNTNKSTNYISKQLEIAYGYQYSVVILLSNQTIGSFVIYCAGGDTVISWTKVNIHQPNWVYIIWASLKYNTQTTNYISGLQKGSGIDSQKQIIIKNIVKSQQQTFSQCGCYYVDIDAIQNKLKQVFGQQQKWTIICKKYSAVNFNSLLKSDNYQYIQMNVNYSKCEYLLVTDNL